MITPSSSPTFSAHVCYGPHHRGLRGVSVFPCSVPVPGPTYSPSMRKPLAAKPKRSRATPTKVHGVSSSQQMSCTSLTVCKVSVKLLLSFPRGLSVSSHPSIFPRPETLVCRRLQDSCTLNPKASLSSAIQDKYLTGWL